MDFYYGLAQLIGVHTLLGLSAYIVLLTGQVSLAQAGFFAVGAYAAGMLTVLGGWHLVPALGASALSGAAVACAVGFPALRVKGLMLVIATLAFGEGVRLFFFNFDYQIAKGGLKVGPLGGEGFRQIRFFPEHGWSTFEVMLFIWSFVLLVTGLLWWIDRSRYGAALRAGGGGEVAAPWRVSAAVSMRITPRTSNTRVSTSWWRPLPSPIRSWAGYRAYSARSSPSFSCRLS